MPAGAGGFTYVGLIILVTIIALVAATTVRVGAVLQRAQAERELLHIGEQFANALKSYAAVTPAGQPPQPPTLQELLKDPRFPGTRRHLRKIFVDPVTGKAEWGIVWLAGERGILGIHSLSTAPPIKIANFPQRFAVFDGKQKLSDWVFTFNDQAPLPSAQARAGQPAAAPAAGTPAGQGPAAPGPVLPAQPGPVQPADPAESPPDTPPDTPPGEQAPGKAGEPAEGTSPATSEGGSQTNTVD